MSEEKEIKVDAKAETITNEKTQKQNDSLNALKEKKAKAEKDAEKAYEQAVKEKEEKERLAREEAERIQREKEEEEARKAQLNKEILSAGAALAASAIGSTVVRKKGGFLKGLLFGLIFGLLIGAAGTWWYMRDPLPAVSGHTDTSTVDADLVIEDDGFLGFTAADFEDAVLGGNGRGGVDHPVHPGYDLLDHVLQALPGGKSLRPQADCSRLFNEDMLPAIYHDLRDGVILHQLLQYIQAPQGIEEPPAVSGPLADRYTLPPPLRHQDPVYGRQNFPVLQFSGGIQGFFYLLQQQLFPVSFLMQGCLAVLLRPSVCFPVHDLPPVFPPPPAETASEAM